MEHWQDRANCRGLDPNLFFPETAGGVEHVREAKKVCAGCDVQVECLEQGFGEKHGVWGMTSEPDRRKLRRARRLQVAS
jgi:WhiB family transcriptional regulator, redox-sensing transcriptional regulator